MENNPITINNNKENILFEGSLDVKVIVKGPDIIIHTKKININSENKNLNNKTNTINQQSDNKNIEIMEIENENDVANNALIFAPNRKKIETYKKIIDGPNEFKRYELIDKCAETHEQFHRYISDDGDCLFHSLTVLLNNSISLKDLKNKL